MGLSRPAAFAGQVNKPGSESKTSFGNSIKIPRNSSFKNYEQKKSLTKVGLKQNKRAAQNSKDRTKISISPIPNNKSNTILVLGRQMVDSNS